MTSDLIWSPRARDDLTQIYIAIGLRDPNAAERYFDNIEQKIALLQSHPRIGINRSDIRPDLRMLVQSPYVILYDVISDNNEGPVNSIEIVRIIDGRRDLKRLF